MKVYVITKILLSSDLDFVECSTLGVYQCEDTANKFLELLKKNESNTIKYFLSKEILL